MAELRSATKDSKAPRRRLTAPLTAAVGASALTALFLLSPCATMLSAQHRLTTNQRHLGSAVSGGLRHTDSEHLHSVFPLNVEPQGRPRYLAPNGFGSTLATAEQSPDQRPTGLTATVENQAVTVNWQWSGPAPTWFFISLGSSTGRTVLATEGVPGTRMTWTSIGLPLPAGTFFVRVAGVIDDRRLPDSDDVVFEVVSYSVTPDDWLVPSAGGTQAVTVSASKSYGTWTATSDQAWLTLSAARGTGSGSVTLTASANPSSVTSRSASASIAGRVVRVTQAARTPTFIITPTNWSALAGGGSRDVEIAASQSDAPWTATSNQSWLSLSAPGGTGTATVTLIAAASTSVEPRTATATIGGQAVTVTQLGRENSFSVAPASLVLPGPGGAASVTVSATTSDAPWSATSSAPWLSISTVSGVGGTTLTLTASPQVSYAPERSATATVAGQTISVRQQATTEPGPPRQPTAALDGNRVVFRWDAPDSGGPPNVYLLEYGFAPGRTDGASVNVGSAQEFAVNVPPGRFFIRMKAQNAYGISAASTEVELRVGVTGEPPARPQSLTTRATGGTVTLAWADPAGGDPPTGYQLEAGTAPGLSNIASVSLGSDTSVAFEGVPPGLYFVRVRGVNSFGVGAPSDDAILAVGGAAEPPHRPTGLLATVTGANVSFRWNAPGSGGAPTGYLLEAGNGGGLSNITTLPLPNVSSFGVDGVPAGVYFVRVRATNALGASAPSNEVIVNVGAGDSVSSASASSVRADEDVYLRPGPPSQLRGWVTGRVVQLMWDGPLSQRAVTGYRVEVASSVDGPTLWSTTTSSVSLTLSAVPPGTYYVRVISVRGEVSSATSNVLLLLIP